MYTYYVYVLYPIVISTVPKRKKSEEVRKSKTEQLAYKFKYALFVYKIEGNSRKCIC